MAIKAGQFLTVAGGFLLDRIQSGGPGQLNISKEQIKELGNFKTVATVRETPDLSWDVETFDVTTELEAILTNANPAAMVNGQQFNLDNSKPIDVISPFKAGQNVYSIVKGLIVPYLTLEQSVYRYGVRANAVATHTLRGDSLYYTPGTPYYQEYTAAGTGPYTLSTTAVPYTEDGDTFHVVGLCYIAPDGTYKRLFFGADYTDTTTTFTLTVAPPAGSEIHAVWASLTAGSYPQSVHPSVVAKPAAVRARDIDLYVGTSAATPVFSRWTDVQSVEITRRVTLENTEEFGNPHYVDSDYDVPTVSGRVRIKPRDPAALWDKVAQVAGVSTTEIAGPNTAITVPIEVRISHPDSGALLRTVYVPDAQFTVPALPGRSGQKVEVDIDFESDSGSLLHYMGARP